MSSAPYENFREPFLKGLEQWRPDEWAAHFADAGAQVCRARHQAS